MKRICHATFVCVFLIAISLAGCTREAPETQVEKTPASTDELDAVVVAPDVYSILHEDERVRVLNMTLPPGVTDGLHSHPNEAVYFIKGSTIRIHLPEGDPIEMPVPDGAPLSHEAWTHTVENIGDALLHAIVVEIKDGALESAGSVPEGMGAHEAAPEVYSVMLEDERVRMIEMKLPAGATDGAHGHPSEAVYFLTGGKLKLYLPNDEVVEAEIPDGGVLSNPSWQHTVENVGETDIHAIIVELKEPAEPAM